MSSRTARRTARRPSAALSSGGGGGRRARASRRRRRRRRPSGRWRGGSRGGAYAGRCRGEVDAGPLGHLVGDPVRVADGAGLGRGVGPRGGEDDDAGGVVDPDHQDERDAEGLERLGVGRGLEQEGGELLEDLEQRRPPGARRTTATGWGCSAARAGGRRRRRATCWPPGPGTGPAPRRSPPRPHPGRAHSMIGVSTLVATPDTATLVDQDRAERHEGEHVAQLADEEAGLLALGLLEDRHQRGAHAREPPQAGVEGEQDADAEDPRRGGLQGVERDPALPADEARAGRSWPRRPACPGRPRRPW